jgi:histidinol-phosphate aminotransferase
LAGLDIGYGLVPKTIAAALSAQGMTNPHLFNRLAVVAATASLKDMTFLPEMVRQVADEREKWFQLFRDLRLRFTASGGNFVFVDAELPHTRLAAALWERGVDIGRAFPPYDQWARISIGLPAENALARESVLEVVTRSRNESKRAR